MRIPALLLVLLLIPGCDLASRSSGVGETGLSFADVSDVELMWVGAPGTAVFNDAASWEAFWYEHTSVTDEQGRPVPPPTIEFDGKTVAAVFLGGGPSGCTNYLQLIRGVSLRGDAAEVRIEQPDSAEGMCDMLISPLHIVAFEKTESVRFVGDLPN